MIDSIEAGSTDRMRVEKIDATKIRGSFGGISSIPAIVMPPNGDINPRPSSAFGWRRQNGVMHSEPRERNFLTTWRHDGDASRPLAITRPLLASLASPSIIPDPFPVPPKACLVIGTFAAVPYVHLQLESRRRNYPHVPLLVHDDASPQGDAIAKLCDKYSVCFSSNETRMPSHIGDLTAFISGFLWAQDIGCNLLVKMSRRFLPLIDWTTSLSELAQRSQHCTFSSYTTSWGFGFRTECVGMAVDPWLDSGNVGDIATLAATADGCFVEAFIHQLAWRLTKRKGARSRQFDIDYGARPPERDGYAPWDFMGTDRETPNANFLWHNADPPASYFRLAQSWGLPYQLKDFQDANQGFGDKPK